MPLSPQAKQALDRLRHAVRGVEPSHFEVAPGGMIPIVDMLLEGAVRSTGLTTYLSGAHPEIVDYLDDLERIAAVLARLAKEGPGPHIDPVVAEWERLTGKQA